MSIVIFIIILAVLILVHEFGHFLAAKLFGIRVDEFGIGYPPRAVTLFRWWNADFTLNWLPFGGFVKIFGENGEVSDEKSVAADAASATASAIENQSRGNLKREKSFVEAPRPFQALVLVAGVAFNILFAWILISVGFMVGLPTSTSNAAPGEMIQNPKLVITMVAADSPALAGGLKSGDTISAVSTEKIAIPSDVLTPETVSEFIAMHGEEKINVSYVRGKESGTVSVLPGNGIIPDRKAIGISMDVIGTLSLPVHKAFFEGARTTINLAKTIAVGLATFLYDAVRGSSDLSQVTGPVGIVGLVGDASRLGFIYLLSFTAFISINLAVINVIPFPALDGGRLLFVIIESIKRSPISPKVANTMNAVGFFLLVGLMVLVTVHDVLKLF